MNKNRKRIGGLVRRCVGAALIVALIAGGVSLASFADMGYVDSAFGLKAEGESARLTATSSEALATSSETSAASSARRTSRLGLTELLEQSADNEDAIIPTWYQVALNGEAIADSDNWNVTLRESQRIQNDTVVRYQLRVTIYPQSYQLGEGDSVTWNLGRIEGLSLDGEFWEELVLSGGVYVGDAMLSYTQDGEVYLYTEFKEAINNYSNITITYWYDCGFVAVNEPTGIVFDLPGYNEPVTAILLPAGGEPTTEEPTTAALTTEEPTTAAPTTAASNKGKGSGGDSDREQSTLARETTKSAETVPESTAEKETETELQLEEPRVQEQSPGDSQDGESEGDAGESDAAESEEVLDINISFGAEVTASHGMQSQVLPNEVLTYRMVLNNDSEEEIKDVRIRDYLPEHTSFVSAGEDGIYGVADGRQYITWMLESLLPGEEVELTFQVRVFPCTPPDYPVRNHVYWQADDSRSVNNQERPENQIDFPMITIG